MKQSSHAVDAHRRMLTSTGAQGRTGTRAIRNLAGTALLTRLTFALRSIGIDVNTMNSHRRTLDPASCRKEAAHVILHSYEDHDTYVAHRGIKETEAESVAYVLRAVHQLAAALIEDDTPAAEGLRT